MTVSAGGYQSYQHGYQAHGAYQNTIDYDNEYVNGWWGPQGLTPPIFPPNPTLGYTPPPVVASPTPYATMMVYDNGWIGWVRNTAI